MVSTATLFIGLGNMGRPMAANLAKSGTELFVHDANPEVSAQVAEALGTTSLQDLHAIPAHVGIVVLMLPNSRIVESVLLGQNGLLDQLESGSLVLDMGSSEPSSTIKLAKDAAKRGIGYVDAPVSGGVAKATTGDLAIMLGGEHDDVDRAMDHLNVMGQNIVHVGPASTGHAAKALNNLLSATNLAAAAEILSIASSVGIAPETMIQVINGSTSRSQASEVKYPNHILPGTFDSGFAMDLMLKDLRIARSLIESHSVEAPIILTAESVARKARETLDSAAPDHTELARYYEAVNNTAFRSNK